MLVQYKIALLLLPIFAVLQVSAQADKIEGLWYNQEKTAKVKIYKAKNDKFYGKIYWLKESVVDGKERTDVNNTDKSKQNEPLLGLVMLKGFVKTSADKYGDGTIYDPKNGKTYSCVITHKGDKLDVQGYVGVAMLGRTTVWTRAE